MKIHNIIDEIIRREGGFVNDSDDRGKATNWGIIQDTLSCWRREEVTVQDVKDLTRDEASEIYEDMYIRKPNFHKIEDEALLGLVVDCGVNSGPLSASKWLQKAAEVEQDGIVGSKTLRAVNVDPKIIFKRLVLIRMEFYCRIVQKDPTQAKFLWGWIRRTLDIAL